MFLSFIRVKIGAKSDKLQCSLACECSTVVKQSSPKPQIKGLNPATGVCTRSYKTFYGHN
jgi:hypothetical protein